MPEVTFRSMYEKADKPTALDAMVARGKGELTIDSLIDDWELRVVCPASGKLCHGLARAALDDTGAIISIIGFRDLSARSEADGGQDICTANLAPENSPQSDCGYDVWSGWMREVASLPSSIETFMATEEGECAARGGRCPKLVQAIKDQGEDAASELLQKCRRSDKVGKNCGLED